MTTLEEAEVPAEPDGDGISALPWWRRRDWQFFGLGCALYLATRFVGLTRFPIYFFCDEAVQATLADGLLHNHFRSAEGILLPPFHRNDQQYNLSLSVYLQIPAVALFGTTVLGTRATSVLFGCLAVVGITVIARQFGLRHWWISPVLLASVPAWFLHSRTAFEVVEMVAAYACFLAAYLLYRYRSPRYAVLVVGCGAATFYSYANGQGLMLLTGLLLLVSDLPYHRAHLRRRAVIGPAGAMFVLVALPYLRERTLHPATTSNALKLLDSYWYRDIGLGEKLLTFWRTYRRGLSPWYWFSSENSPDLSRHLMKGLGHVWWPLLPFVVVGLVLCLANWRSAKHRLVLVALLAAPFSAAMVEVVITRALVTIVPITVLACLGIDRVLGWLPRPAWRMPTAALMAVVLAGFTVGMTQGALTDGPRWYPNYGLYGMQWGARQVYEEIDVRLRADPDLHVVVSPGWANNTNVFIPFFIGADRRDRVTIQDIDDYAIRYTPFDEAVLFVLSAEDHADAVASDKFVLPAPDLEVPWPDGRTGFVFTHLRYVDDVEARFEADRARRLELQTAEVSIDGEQVEVRYPRLDTGEIADAFDGDETTVARGAEANPFVIELELPRPRPIREIELVTHRAVVEITTILGDAAGNELLRSQATYDDLPELPTIVISVAPSGGTPVTASRIRLELRDVAAADLAHLHVYELRLR